MTGVRSSWDSRATSCCRRVERSTRASCAASTPVRRRSLRGAVVSSSIVRVTPDDRSAPPCAARLTAVRISSPSESFRTYPEAPATSIPRTISWSSCPESATALVGEIRLQPPGRLDPVHRRHPDVHQHDVGCERADEAERLHARAGLTDHLGSRTSSDRSDSEAGVVVDDEHPDRPGVTNRAGKDRRFHERKSRGGGLPAPSGGCGFQGHTTRHGW